jgi:hemolysin III
MRNAPAIRSWLFGEPESASASGEELANSISHGIALLAAIGAVPILVVSAVRHGDPGEIIGASVFGATMVLLYLGSTLYHLRPEGRGKDLLQIVDHGAIYLLIAGTYTPFTLGVLRGPWGWTLFGLVWGLALAGIGLKASRGIRHPIFSTGLYITMGWLVLIGGRPVWLAVPSSGRFWLLAGGIAYTVGVPFYAATKVRYSHFVWHLFVVAGTACHFIAVLLYAA